MILIDDGRVGLRVRRIDGGRVHCSVEQPGVVRDQSGVHLPSRSLRVSALTEKDKADLSFGLSIGGGVRYVDSVIRPVSANNVPPPPNQTNMRTAPDYWVVDMMASYAINDNVTLQLNGYNLTDELYVATLNNSGARYSPGAPRSALLTVNFSF